MASPYRREDLETEDLDANRPTEHYRISFDVTGEDAQALQRIVNSYADLRPSPSQVAKMLFKRSLTGEPTTKPKKG